MIIKRKIVHIDSPPVHPGFLGKDHTARPVIQRQFADSDPFVLLMDDMLDKKDDVPVGGPHPHAGFETVSLLLEGEIGDGIHTMKAGGLQLMTAGSGVVHSETIEKRSVMRLLQLWLALPKKDRWAPPRWQDIPLENVPVFQQDGLLIRVYSGSLKGVDSPLQNYTPLIIADVTIDDGTATTLEITADFNSFLYILDGAVLVGDDQRVLSKNQVGWLNLETSRERSELPLVASSDGVRFILYSGKPTGDQIVSHGPFIADSPEEINRLYQEFRQGKMKHISTIPNSQKLFY